RAGGARAGHMLRRVERLGRIFRGLILLLYGLDLAIGLLTVVRRQVGDYVLLDELLVLALPLGMLLGSWVCYYEVECALRSHRPDSPEAQGALTRRDYVLDQFRHQVALLLVPLLL